MFAGVKMGPADPRPLPNSLWSRTTMHSWVAKLPAGFEPGTHVATVTAVDEYGRRLMETMTFEVGEMRHNPYFDLEAFRS